MRYLEEIKQRHSCRSYQNKPLNENEQNRLNALIETINQESGLTISFIEDGRDAFNSLRKSYGLFKGVYSIIVIKGKTNDSHLEEKCGYYGEWLVLEMTNMKLGTCWVGGTYDRKSPIFSVDSDERIVAVITAGMPEKENIKDKLVHSTMTRKRRTVQQLSVTEGNVPEWFFQGVEAAVMAPSAVMRQRTRFFYRNNRTMAVTDDEVDMDRVDLGIAKFHFECAADGKFELGNPAVFHKS